MKLLLDEMYTQVIAQQLRERGIDAVSVHEPPYRALEGAPDRHVHERARQEGRALVTENTADFPLIEVELAAAQEPHAGIVYTTNRQFPPGEPGTIGRLVRALEALARRRCELTTDSLFLRRVGD